MNRIMRVFHGLFFIICLCAVLSGCSLMDNAIKDYSSDKEQCFLDNENVTQFLYKETYYTILNDTVSNGSLGDWIGYIRQLVAVDENGMIILQENMETATFQTLRDLADKAPSAKYIIPFLNVYAAPNDASYLIVEVNGGYHKAVKSDQITDTDTIFDYKVTAEKTGGKYEINPQNATQLICGDKIYQVTSEVIPEEQLGNYLDILAERVTFNSDTKMPLTKEELNKIDWAGTSSEQRESWFYKDVYEISGTATSEAVAVKINQQYYIAKAQ